MPRRRVEDRGRRDRSSPSGFLVGPQAASLLASLPGVSEIRIESEDSIRAVLSYRWRDPGTTHPGIEPMLDSEGIRLI